MKLHKRQKRVVMGYQAYVWLDKGWSLVDGFFGTALEADTYVKRRFAAGTKSRTQALRFNCVPLEIPTNNKGGLK